jgi:DNA-binding transcriptional LysR family regulator
MDDLRLMSGPYWGELRIFLAVAKAKSFNRAAEALNMSQPTVSRQVKRLQDVIGSQLLLPSRTGVELTARGRELAEALLALDEKLGALAQDLRSETRETEGTVRVTATEAFAGLFVVPRVAAFNEQYPKVHLHMRNPLNLLNFKDNQSDVLVGFAPMAQDGIEARHVGYVHLIPIASQTYIEENGIPTQSNLHAHRFIDTEYYSSQNSLWASWRSAVSQGEIAHTCDNSFAYALLVKASRGIGLLGNYTLADASAVPLALDIHVVLPIFIVASTERLQAGPVRAVYEWLCEIFSSQHSWFAEELNLSAYPPKLRTEGFERVTAGTALA